jgi:hypothetical protein
MIPWMGINQGDIQVNTPLVGYHFVKNWLGKNDVRLKTLNKGCCHTVALPFTIKSILMQKKNYENSNISPCKIIIL